MLALSYGSNIFLWCFFQVLMMGEPFFNCQIGIVGCRALCLKGIMGVLDFEENVNRREEVKKKKSLPNAFIIISDSVA